MKIGTKSVLFGAHCFFVHPWFVALGWFKLYGFGRVQIGTQRVATRSRGGVPVYREKRIYASLLRPALWVAFFVHDVGYLGMPNMDGEEGERHPIVGARLMTWLFDGAEQRLRVEDGAVIRHLGAWGRFVLYHSRFLSKQYGAKPSALCMADKMALSVTPWWLYLPMALSTGEAREYSFHKRRDHSATKWNGDPLNDEERRLASSDSMVDRVRGMQRYTRRWIEEHRDGRDDTWTPSQKAVAS